MPYPWGSGRDAERYLLAAIEQVYTAVRDAIRELLDIIRAAIMPAEGAPDMQAWPADIDSRWDRIIRARVVPRLADAVAAIPRLPGDIVAIDSLDLAQQHLEDVPSRLRDWPREAWPIVQARLAEGLAAGDDARGLRERVGDALDITSLTRSTEAQIARIRARIDAGVPAAQEAALRARLRDLQETTDRSRREWEWRADRVARTETAGAVAAGVEAYAQYRSQVTGVAVWRQWWSSLDSRVRPSHALAHGQVQPPGARFEVGGAQLRFPADPLGPPQETINCRCSLLLLSPGEARAAQDEYVSMLTRQHESV